MTVKDKEKTELKVKKPKTLIEVRKVEMRGESFGVQSKGKVSLNRGIKSRVKDTSINIEQVL